MRRISNRQEVLIKLSKRESDEKALIRKMRDKVKNDKTVREKFKEYGIPLSDINTVSIQFDDLDVSAKTKYCKIYLNRKLLDKVGDPTSYLVHELVHYAQQKSGHTEGAQAKDYLDKKTELEAFEAQVDYKKKDEGEEAAERYTEGLLNYHDYDINSEEGREKKKELMGE